MSHFGTQTTADEASAALHNEIAKKTVLITGVSPGGLAAEFAVSIAAYNPARLILASRTPSNIAVVAEQVRARNTLIEIREISLDLSSPDSVRTAAFEINDYPGTIDVLVNSAAVLALPNYTKTQEGYELTFATNHLGHFLLTNLIMPKLSSPGGRIVSVAALAQAYTDILYDDPWFSNGEKYNKWMAYAQSKTANVLFALSLSEKLRSRGIQACSLHPGAIITPLRREITDEEVSAALTGSNHDLKTLQQGAATYVTAAFDPTIKDASGAYMLDNQIVPAAPHSSDPQNAERLWKFSEELVGQKFQY